MTVVQVTSPSAGEGKTTTTANLGVTLAQAGLTVIVLSCDLRRPRVDEFFGLSNTVGFTSVLLGESSLSEALQQVPGLERLRVLTSGPLPPNPSELLASNRTTEVRRALGAHCDVVLVDSPPVLPVTDAAVLSSKVDGILVVVTAGLTSKRGLARALEVLRQMDAPIVGTVLNGASPDGTYGYTYYYGRDDNPDPKPRKRGRTKEPTELRRRLTA